MTKRQKRIMDTMRQCTFRELNNMAHYLAQCVENMTEKERTDPLFWTQELAEMTENFDG